MAAALQRDNSTQMTEKELDSDNTTLPTQVNNETSCQHCKPPPTFAPTNQEPLQTDQPGSRQPAPSTTMVHTAVDYNHSWYKQPRIYQTIGKEPKSNQGNHYSNP